METWVWVIQSGCVVIASNWVKEPDELQSTDLPLAFSVHISVWQSDNVEHTHHRFTEY